MQTQTPNVFLMNPRNMAFLQKKVKRPFFQEMSANGLWALTAFLVVGFVIFAVLAGPAWKSWLDMKNGGVTTQGQVAGIRFEDKDVSYFYVVYSFDANNRTYEKEQKVDFDQYNLTLERTDAIPVRYKSSDPSVSKLDEPFKDFADFRVPGTLLGGGYLLFMFIAVYYHFDRRMSNSELTAQGKLLKGTVVAASGDKPDADGAIAQMLQLFFMRGLYYLRRKRQSEFRIKIRYKFVSPVNKKEITRTETGVRNDLNRRHVPDAGTPVAVLYRTDRHCKLL